MNKQTNRREFLRTFAAGCAGAIGFPFIVPASALGRGGAVAPSNRISLAFIGIGNHGVRVNINNFLGHPDAQCAIVCDVDQNHAAYGRDTINESYGNQDCAVYNDFRDVLARRDIDAVVISTPDHWHVPLSIAAAKAGKDVFCEKPLTLAVSEGRILCDVIRRYGRILQTGTGNRASQQLFHPVELVRNGRIGRLQTMYTWLPPGHNYMRIRSDGRASPGGQSPKVHPIQPVPKQFNYDMWLGPAPEAPYTPGRCHWNYRWILDYSGGQLTDWGAHLNDMAQLANASEFSGPVSVEGQGIFPEDGLYNTAVKYDITYEYANGVKLICRDGDPGFRFEGSEGWVAFGVNIGTIQASAPRILKSRIGPDGIHLRTCEEGEQRDFLNCVKTREDPYAPVEIGHRTASLCHIGNIAMKLGRKLHWDPDTEQFHNDDEANRMLSRPMREPWCL